MIRHHALIALNATCLSLFHCPTAFAQPDVGARNHFQSHFSELRQAMHGQERIRERLALKEASALGPKHSWSVTIQGAGFRLPVPAASAIHYRAHTHWSVGAGWYAGLRQGSATGSAGGPLIHTEASIGGCILQGKIIRLISSSDILHAPWLAAAGVRRRQLIVPGLWLYALAEYQWKHPEAGGSLITWAGLEWQIRRLEIGSKSRISEKTRLLR